MAFFACVDKAPRLWDLSGTEVRHFVIPNASTIQAGAFAGDESVFFTGGTDKMVRVWEAPTRSKQRHAYEARITYLGNEIERGTDMVRVRAALENPVNPEHRLRAACSPPSAFIRKRRFLNKRCPSYGKYVPMRTHGSNQAGEGRTHVRVRARQNLRIVAQENARATKYVVKDPITMRYFHLDSKQHYLFSLMDGARTLAQLKTEYERQFRPDRLAMEELEDFVAQLLDGGLVTNNSPSASERLIERAEKQSLRTWLARLNLLYIKIPLGHPERWLAPMQPLVRMLFGHAFLVRKSALVAGALVLLTTHWREFLVRLPAYDDFFRWQNFLYFWLAFGLIKLLHEMGHALACSAWEPKCRKSASSFCSFFQLSTATFRIAVCCRANGNAWR